MFLSAQDCYRLKCFLEKGLVWPTPKSYTRLPAFLSHTGINQCFLGHTRFELAFSAPTYSYLLRGETWLIPHKSTLRFAIVASANHRLFQRQGLTYARNEILSQNNSSFSHRFRQNKADNWFFQLGIAASIFQFPRKNYATSDTWVMEHHVSQ